MFESLMKLNLAILVKYIIYLIDNKLSTCKAILKNILSQNLMRNVVFGFLNI